MFEEIDRLTIDNANATIKEIYEKFLNQSILAIISKEEIVERDFDNMFIFEDFFGDYLAQNRDIDGFKENLIIDIVDLIDANAGDITIEELYEIITSSEEDTQYVSPTQENKHLDVTGIEVESDYELVYGTNHKIDLSGIDDISSLEKQINRQIKRDNMDFSAVFDSTKRVKFKEDISTKSLGDSKSRWNLLRKKR